MQKLQTNSRRNGRRQTEEQRLGSSIELAGLGQENTTSIIATEEPTQRCILSSDPVRDEESDWDRTLSQNDSHERNDILDDRDSQSTLGLEERIRSEDKLSHGVSRNTLGLEKQIRSEDDFSHRMAYQQHEDHLSQRSNTHHGYINDLTPDTTHNNDGTSTGDDQGSLNSDWSDEEYIRVASALIQLAWEERCRCGIIPPLNI